MLTYKMLYQILREAEDRVANELLPADVRERSKETVSICNERMAREGLTIHALKKLARARAVSNG